MTNKTSLAIGIDPSGTLRGGKAVRNEHTKIKKSSREVWGESQKGARLYSAVLGKVKLAAAGAAAALAAASGASVRTTKDFNAAISELSAITGATGKDLAFLAEKSKEFGRTTTLSASQAAAAFKLIASAKPDLLSNGAALAQVTQEAIALSEATGSDLTTAADTLGTTMNQFGLAAGEASRVINALAAGSKFGSADVAALSESLKNTGATAKVTGLSIEETVATLEALAAGGIKGSEAGTGLSSILSRLAKTAKDDFNPEIVGIAKAFENMAAAGLDTNEKLKLFGLFQRKTGETLVAQAGIIGKLTKEVTGSTVAYEQQAVRVDNLNGDILALKSAYEGLQIEIGTNLTPIFRSWVQDLTGSVRALTANERFTRLSADAIDFMADVMRDVKIAMRETMVLVQTSGADWGYWADLASRAVDNVRKAVKFLWDNFVVLGPANFRLGVQLIIGTFDMMRIKLAKKNAQITTAIEIAFSKMSDKASDIFGGMRDIILDVYADIVRRTQDLAIQASYALGQLGANDVAFDVAEISVALSGVQSSITKSRQELEKQDELRELAIKALIDELALLKSGNTEYDKQLEARAEVLRMAIAERDAVRERIQAERDATTGASRIGVSPPGTGEGAGAGGGGGGGGGGAGGRDTPGKQAAADAKEVKEVYRTVTEQIKDDIVSVEDASVATFRNVRDSMTDAVLEGKLAFDDLASSVLKSLARIALSNAFTQIFGPLVGGLFSTSGTQYNTSGVLQSSANIAPGELILPPGPTPFPAPGFAKGGSFTVPGAGSPDSKLVRFMATPGEEVAIRTPAQQRGGGGGNTTVNVVNNTPFETSVNRERGDSGKEVINVIVGQLTRDVMTGGPLNRAMRTSFGLRSQLNPR